MKKNEFPYDSMPWKLIHKVKKGEDKRTCYFECEEHMQKYIKSGKYRKNQYTIKYGDE